MRKFWLLILSLLTLTFTACRSQDTTENITTQTVYNIAIVQQAGQSTDEIRDALNAELTALESQKEIKLQRKLFYVQDDMKDMEKIGKQIVKEKCDAIIPISTTVTQYMIDAAEQKIPVIFATDHSADPLHGLDAVSGVGGAINTNLIFDMMFAQKPDIQTVGLLYPADCYADEIQAAKEYLDANGITYVEQITEPDDHDLVKPASILADQVNVVFTPSNSFTAENQRKLANIFKDRKIPYYTGSPTSVQNGAFASCSVDYAQLGKTCADLTLAVLETGVFPPCRTLNDSIITVNTDTAEQIGANYAVFYDLGQCQVRTTPTQSPKN